MNIRQMGCSQLCKHLLILLVGAFAGISQAAVDGSYEPEAVDIVFDPPADGKLKFRAGPKDKSAPACFMRATVLP